MRVKMKLGQKQHLVFPTSTFLILIQVEPAKITSLCSQQENNDHEKMEDTTWDQRIQALTHIIINPTTKPNFESQIFISSQVPCYLNWDYPPILCTKYSTSTFPSVHLKWAFSVFLKSVSRLGAPETSWRSKCPYQQPPPLILAKGVEEAQWGDEQRRQYVRKRFKRRHFGSDVHPLIPFIVPNLMLFFLLFWNPFPIDGLDS